SVVVQSASLRQSSPGVPIAQKYSSQALLKQSSSVTQLLSFPPRPQVPPSVQLRLRQSLLTTHAEPVKPAAHLLVLGLHSPLRQSLLPSQGAPWPAKTHTPA